MTETVGPVDLLVRDAELLVTMTGEELRGGWVAIKDGFVKAVASSHDEPAEAAEVLSASGCLITPGLHQYTSPHLGRRRPPVQPALRGAASPLLRDAVAGHRRAGL